MNKKKLALVIALVLLLGSMSAIYIAADAVHDRHRLGSSIWVEHDLAGVDRYMTGREVDLYFSQLNGIPSSIVMVKATDFPDALSAASLAGYLRCPIVLYQPGKDAEGTRMLLQEDWKAGVRDVYMVGGGYSDADLKQIGECVSPDAVFHTEFLGTDRYHTAELVCRYVMARTNSKACVVASGTRFPDALSMSGWCYRDVMPLLLVDGGGNARESTMNLINSFDTAYIAGGTAVVSAGTEEAIGDKANRICGITRVETSRAIANYFVQHDSPTQVRDFSNAIIATGDNFPDALVGGPLAGSMGSPILLVQSSGLSENMMDMLQNNIVNTNTSGVDLYFLGAVAYQDLHQTLMTQLANAQG